MVDSLREGFEVTIRDCGELLLPLTAGPILGPITVVIVVSLAIDSRFLCVGVDCVGVYNLENSQLLQ